MAFTMPPVLIRVAMACASLAFLLQLVGLATPSWVTTKIQNSGLWKQCRVQETKFTQVKICQSFEDVPDADVPEFVHWCRTLGILALLLLGGCVAVSVIACFRQIDKMALVANRLAFVAAFCVLIEFAVVAGKINDRNGNPLPAPDLKFGYSFILTVLACVLAAAAGVCFKMVHSGVAAMFTFKWNSSQPAVPSSA